jgi:hypothetical protein
MLGGVGIGFAFLLSFFGEKKREAYLVPSTTKVRYENLG